MKKAFFSLCEENLSRNQPKFTKKMGLFTALLMENALIFCNPHDNIWKLFATC